jgi:uncharacterized protein Yka (UPF0111/DUF47 family)
MDDNYHREVIEGIAAIRKMQQELARTAEKQIELLERLVEVEHTSNDFKKALDRIFARLDIVEDEVDKWRLLRQLITWIGPAGLIATIWGMLHLHDFLNHGVHP